MSLINKMLQDLDARGTPAGQSFPSNVKPVAAERRGPSLRLIGVGAGALLVCAAGGVLGWFGWQHLHVSHPRQPAAAAAAAKPLAIKPAQGMGGSIAPAPVAANLPPKVAPPGAVEAPAAAPVPPPLPRDSSAAAAPADPAPARARKPEPDVEAEPARPAYDRRDPAAPAYATRPRTRAREEARADPPAPAASAASASQSKSVLPMEPDSAEAREARRAAAIELATRETRMARLAKLSAQQAHAAGARGKARSTVDAEGLQEAPAQRAENEYRRALASLQEGRMAEAIASLQLALRVDPGHDAARQTLVGLLVEAGRSDDAIRELQVGLSHDPRQPALAMLLARLQIERGGSGIETLLRTLPYAGTSTSESAEYHGFLAGALQRQQRHREAVEQYQQALRTAPGNGVWWMGLGISLQADRRNAEALDAFQRARGSSGLNAELQGFVERRIQLLSH